MSYIVTTTHGVYMVLFNFFHDKLIFWKNTATKFFLLLKKLWAMLLLLGNGLVWF